MGHTQIANKTTQRKTKQNIPELAVVAPGGFSLSLLNTTSFQTKYMAGLIGSGIVAKACV